jgi:DNA-binding transcriptional regulator GbsR (MarR family)
LPRPWYLISSHGVVLLHIAGNSSPTLREMSEALGLTERRISQIVQDLAEAEYLTVERVGRRSIYQINQAASMRHPTLQHVKLGDVIELLMIDLPRLREAKD